MSGIAKQKLSAKKIAATNPGVDLALLEKWRRQKAELKRLGVDADARRELPPPHRYKTQPVHLKVLGPLSAD
jgi:hypothetical protein